MFSSAACHDSGSAGRSETAKIFGDNMVLQQQTECNLWGTADANKVVKVRASWNGKTYKTRRCPGKMGDEDRNASGWRSL